MLRPRVRQLVFQEPRLAARLIIVSDGRASFFGGGGERHLFILHPLQRAVLFCFAARHQRTGALRQDAQVCCRCEEAAAFYSILRGDKVDPRF